MPKIKIDTIHDPIEIEVRGHVFIVRPITGGVIQKNLKFFDDLLRGGNLHASHERLMFLFDVQTKEEKQLIDDMEIREIQEITEAIIRHTFGYSSLMKPGGQPISEKEAEKNASKVGATG